MTRPATLWLAGVAAALAVAGSASAQGTTKKELAQKVLQIQQAEIESVARSIVERPAAQMMQEAGLAMQRQVAPDKREAMGKAIEAEVKKYIDEAFPLVRERAVRIAPSTIGATLEEKLSEDELKQLVAWLESPVYKKYQALGPDMRNGFIQKLLADARPVVDPKVQALDGRLRAIFGVPPATPGASAAAPARPAAPAARASGKQ
ncbi:MAG: hypothetical protein ABI699_15430 [Caldimonas sp.]